MVQITLSAEEAALLAEVLKSYLSDLRMEIADTDSKSFRQSLKQRQTVLEKILGQVPQMQT